MLGRKIWGKEWPSLGWTDGLGRKWTKPSDILENPELQNLIPPGQRVSNDVPQIALPVQRSNQV